MILVQRNGRLQFLEATILLACPLRLLLTQVTIFLSNLMHHHPPSPHDEQVNFSSTSQRL